MNQVIELLKNHRSIRQFTDESVTQDQLRAIIEAAGAASTSNFIQAYSVINVTNNITRQHLSELAGGQKWVLESPIFLVFCADLKRAQSACEFENINMDSGYTEQFMVSTVDVSLAAQNAMIAAESLGLGGVFIGGIRNNPQAVCELLNIPKQVTPIFGMCLGYPAAQPEQKPRLPVDVVLMQERYQEDVSYMKAYNDTCHAYYLSRSTSARTETWTHQIASMVSKPARQHMKEFLAKQGLAIK
ncbi:NADPH-dependent oxidoreductase [Psychromonas marina]|uniref:NADPH-dependent oxidoreductase n=1 Tax=Psychromonas marina TaxID=88364 RepID=A0ABQ6DXC4_9GAMM|nr:oxygen-insensitive NADPH nitroreductase [Psychromonas marina]GLS89503.1 NADPH-dependent oxidoreductase [Psychromonas marina]